MNKLPILIVEDDQNLQQALADILNDSGFATVKTNNPQDALEECNKQSFGLILLDVNLGGDVDGISLLKDLKKLTFAPIIIMTAFANYEDAVFVMKQGAVDYLVKPFSFEKLIKKVQCHFLVENIGIAPIAYSSKMKNVMQLARKVSGSQVNVLITGESGTGKEVLAKYIHANSKYSDKEMLAVNCAAIPENMLEAVLFGYEKGAFTGAYSTSPGKFELANHSTIFLDEIGEMPLALQVKILRVIQERAVERLGSKKSIKLNIRIISATNCNLRELVQRKLFRSDLYFRLNVFPIHLPKLVERSDDVLMLAQAILNDLCCYSSIAKPMISDQAKELMLGYNWPGNIRELHNALQRALVVCDGVTINKSDLILEELSCNDILMVKG